MGDVTMLGLGAMGSALAGAFIGNGRRLTVWNRSPAGAEALALQGAIVAPSVADAVAASPLVVLCLLDYRAASEVLGSAAARLSGRTIVNLTNGTPEEARSLGRWVGDRGGRYVDGGIMAIPPMIGTRDAFILYSGSRDGFEVHRNTLEVLGEARFLGPDAGLAPLVDLALLAAMYGLFSGFLHGAAMAGSAGIEARDFTGMAVPWLSAMTGALPEIGRQIDARDYVTDVASGLAMQATAVENIVAASRAAGVDAGLILPMRALMQRRIADGLGAEDIAGVIEHLRRRRRRPAAAKPARHVCGATARASFPR